MSSEYFDSQISTYKIPRHILEQSLSALMNILSSQTIAVIAQDLSDNLDVVEYKPGDQMEIDGVICTFTKNGQWLTDEEIQSSQTEFSDSEFME